MNKEKVNEMINEYFDGELDKNKEPMLFSYLSKYNESREYFKSLNRIKESLKQAVEEFPGNLDERILLSVENAAQSTPPTKENRNSFFTIISYSFAVAFFIISIFLFKQSSEYKQQLELTMLESNYQKQVLNLIYNSLPAAEVVSETENQIVVTAEM